MLFGYYLYPLSQYASTVPEMSFSGLAAFMVIALTGAFLIFRKRKNTIGHSGA